MKKETLVWILKLLKGRLPTFVFILSIWMVTIIILYNIGLLRQVNPIALLAAHLGAFFFALTTSPVTWVIKSFGLEIGSNTPNHFQVDKIVEKNGKKTSIIVREYDTVRNEEKINKILDEQTKDL